MRSIALSNDGKIYLFSLKKKFEYKNIVKYLTQSS